MHVSNMAVERERAKGRALSEEQWMRGKKRKEFIVSPPACVHAGMETKCRSMQTNAEVNAGDARPSRITVGRSVV